MERMRLHFIILIIKRSDVGEPEPASKAEDPSKSYTLSHIWSQIRFVSSLIFFFFSSPDSHSQIINLAHPTQSYNCGIPFSSSASIHAPWSLLASTQGDLVATKEPGGWLCGGGRG